MEESLPMCWLQDLEFNLLRVALVGQVLWTEPHRQRLRYLELLHLSGSTFAKVSSMVDTEDLGKALTQAEVLSKQS